MELEGIQGYASDPTENEPIAYWQIELIEKILPCTPYNWHDIELSNMSYMEAMNFIEILRESMVNPIYNGKYNQTDIKKHIDKIIKTSK